MEHEKYSYVEALKWLANRYGVEVEETYVSDEQREQQLSAESLYILNSFAAKFFSDVLFNTEEGQDIGLSYLKERGFREDIIHKFQLGYSPESLPGVAYGKVFVTEALNKQFNQEILIRSGLVAIRNDQLADNYRGRVIFPVHNHSGKILGFGARILKTNDRAPKYINTPENELYIKSRILYGSYFARQAIDKADECLLVEGYTDVISLHQAGIENVVASGGTSLTSEQLRLIRKYSSNLTIIYDGDAAGIKAALRGLDLALEEGLNVKLVLIPDKEDPDSYVNKVGRTEFIKFIDQNKKDFILFQLEVALKDAGSDSTKKAEVVNRMAETISRINKAEDFTKQQDYIQQCSQLLKIDESGLHALVNKFIRDRIATQERKLPFDEAKKHEENAKRGESTDYDEETFNLLFKDELQEKEIARILLEFGSRNFDGNKLVAQHVFDEMVDENLIDNAEVIRLIRVFREQLNNGRTPDKNFFIYNEDPQLSSLSVSLLNFPYEESERWRKDYSQSSGYQQKLFEQSYEDFIRTVSKDNESELQGFLKMDEDRTNEEVESAINYLKLRKVKRMLLENQIDMEKPHTPEEYHMLHGAHDHLKQMEISLSKKLGTVIIR